MNDLRPIAPIDTRGLSPATPSSDTPIFEMVDPRTLFVDPAYQRGLGERCQTCEARFRGGRLAAQCAPCAYGGKE